MEAPLVPAPAGLGGPLTGYVGPFSAALVQQVPILTGTDNFRSWLASARRGCWGGSDPIFREFQGVLLPSAGAGEKRHLLHEIESSWASRPDPPRAREAPPLGV